MRTLERDSDDRPLIEAAQHEPARFAELYEQNFVRIYSFFARRVATREEAQDLTAEVFHQALASIKGFKWQGAPFIAWLYGIAANVLAKHWHKQGRHPAEKITDLSGARGEIERSVMLAQIVESLAGPETRDRSALYRSEKHSRNCAGAWPQRRRHQAIATSRA